ncbi:MAG: hypothetical protein AB7I35_01480 [Ramlibacter sp.]
MTATTIIALTGAAGAGKDSAANILATHARFTRLAFADPLRAEVAHAFDLTARADLLSGRDTKDTPHDALALRNCKSFCFIGAVALATHACVNSAWLDAPRSPRQVLQWWGTEYRRAENPAYWTRALALRLSAAVKANGTRFVITDCRMANELALVRNLGGVLWRLHRPGLQPVEGQHSSAAEWQGFDANAEIRNHGTLMDLRTEVLRQWWAMDSGLAAHEVAVHIAQPAAVAP